MADQPQPLLSLNQIDSATGQPMLPSMNEAQFAQFLLSGQLEIPTQDAELRLQQDDDHYGVKAGIDEEDLNQAGWGVIIPQNTDPKVIQALQPLLKMRQQETGALYREMDYQPGETYHAWLARQGAGPGPVDPQTLPYYLLLVGDPETIPYRFQIQLDVQHAVGRIYFPKVAHYSRYAQSLVAAAKPENQLARTAHLFAPAHDNQTHNSLENLATPLYKLLKERGDLLTTFHKENQATRKDLANYLGGPQTPSLLFTAGHGAYLGKGHPKHAEHMGGLQCQDPKYGHYTLLETRQGLPRQHYLTGEDIDPDAKLLGMIGFFFGCYTAGSPKEDMFQTYYDQLQLAKEKGNDDLSFFDANWQRPEQAETCLVAQLPMSLLSHPQGGASAIIGHIDRAWTYSFRWQARTITSAFESVITHLANGGRVGAAMEYFNQKHAEYAVSLAEIMDDIRHGLDPDPKSFLRLWMGYHDSRGFVVVGDPAARLHMVPQGTVAKPRAALNLESTDSQPTPEPLPSPTTEWEQLESTDDGMEEYAFADKDAAEPTPEPHKTVRTQLGDNGDYAQTTWTDQGITHRVPILENGSINKELWEIHRDLLNL